MSYADTQMIKKIKNRCLLWIVKQWYKKKSILFIFIPFAYIYKKIAQYRFDKYKNQLKPSHKRAPVLVIGNITVGGAGKTPCVIAVVNELQQQGFHPGIVSRGYGARNTAFPYLVTPKSTVIESGDEALLLALELQIPVVIDPNRERAVNYLLDHFANVDIVISDDGLQHYTMPRDIEIAVVDAQREFGNGLCLPAGPLRESIDRLYSVDLVIAQGRSNHYAANFILDPNFFAQLKNPENKKLLNHFIGKTVHAIAAIGNPERFFNFLEQYGIHVIRHPLPDHAWITPEDLHYEDAPIIMTAKDAVKCFPIATDNCWYLQVKPVLNDKAISALHSLVDLYKSK